MLIYAVADIHGRRDRIALIRSKILQHKPDVLVVAHPPPRETLDEVFGRFHSGCRSLQKIVVNKQPRLLICGHIHERPGALFVGETNIETKAKSLIQAALVSCHLCNVAKMTVIPAEAGIQKRRSSQKYWIPTFVGMTSA